LLGFTPLVWGSVSGQVSLGWVICRARGSDSCGISKRVPLGQV